MKHFKEFIACLLIFVTSVVGLLFMVGVGHAATYNFYFNNVEQGDNSTATPRLRVDTKGSKNKVKSSKKGENFIEKNSESSTTLPPIDVKKSESIVAAAPAEALPTERVEVSESVSPALKVPLAETQAESDKSETEEEGE